jgi:hypothetical protein
MEYNLAQRMENIESLIFSQNENEIPQVTKYLTKINTIITKLEQTLSMNFDNSNDIRNKILDRYMFIVFWYVKNKLECMTEDKINKLLDSENLLQDLDLNTES